MFNKISCNMSLNVMDAYQRLSCRIGNRFCLRHPHQEGAYKPRPIGYANGIYILQSHSGFQQRRFYDLVDLLNMLSGCNLRNNTAIQRMEIYLG